ncbi:protein NDRG3-like [Brevipalpus obovatus]|uniref:protein NDRG3-like n=1 Tax=Brevipalpus obovatus TaxID=246614 RepID=UPI003D9DF385
MNSKIEHFEFQDIELGSRPRLNFIPILTPIRTISGLVKVFRHGADLSPTRPVIITYHDIGMNSSSNFKSFFNHQSMGSILKKFCVIHINAPGQEDKSTRLPDNYFYPSMDQLADQIGAVCSYYEIRHFIGLGVGAGANILSRFALKYPDFVDGLFLINCTSTQASWTEWSYQKLNSHHLRRVEAQDPIPQSVVDYLLWHNYGLLNEASNGDLIFLFKQYFADKSIHPFNLANFISVYIARSDLHIERTSSESASNCGLNFKCPVLMLVGSWSAHIEDTIYMNTRLNPEQTTWMKLDDCGMPLEERPGKVSEALRLFIQGLGYTLPTVEGIDG